MVDASEVRKYYDEFLSSRMLSYRLYSNPRIEAAVARARTLVHPAARVLDVGCGIGLVAELLAQDLPSGSVVGVDISPKNVAFAKKCCKATNCSFHECDVIAERERLMQLCSTVDLVLLIDVLEHIPLEKQEDLIASLASVLRPDGALLITIPTPAYQAHLRETNPSELQLIDLDISLRDLDRLAAHARLHIVSYSEETVWLKRQYAHCVLVRDASVAAVAPPSAPVRFLRRLARAFEHHVLVPIRRRRYLSEIVVES